MRSYEVRIGPKFNNWCLYEKAGEHLDTETQKIHTGKKQVCNDGDKRWESCSYKPGNNKDCQQPPEIRKRKEKILP